MSDTLLVPHHQFYCTNHQGQKISKINLTPQAASRLHCDKCPNAQNIFPIEIVFEYLNNQATKYRILNSDIKRIKQLILTAQSTILRYINNLQAQISKLESTFEERKVIKEDELNQIIGQQSNYTAVQLAAFLDQLSQNVQIVDEEIKSKYSSFPPEENEKKKNIEKSLKNLIEQYKQPSCDVHIKAGISNIDFNYDGSLVGVVVKRLTNQVALEIFKVHEHQITPFKQIEGQIIKCLSFSNTNNSFAVGNYSGEVHFWNENGIMSQTLENNISDVNCLSFSNKDQFLAIGSGHLIICQKTDIWEENVQFDLDAPIQSLCFNQADSTLAVGDYSQVITLFTYSANSWNKTFQTDILISIPRSLAFDTEQNLFFVSTNTNITFLKHSSYQVVIGKTVQQEIISSNYNFKRNILSLCHKDHVQFYQLSNNSLVDYGSIPTQASITQFSKDGLKVAINSQEELKIYSMK